MIAAAAGTAAYRARHRPPPPAPPVAQATGGIMLAERSRGDTTAPVTIYEFSDFQCPYCRQFWETTMPALEREYVATGKVRLVFVNYPIAQLHPNAPAAHRFAMCAARQGRFWPAHDLLFRRQHEWERSPDPEGFFRGLGDSLALQSDVLNRCLRQQSEQWVVEADVKEGTGLGINGTPAFIINGGLLPGAQPIETWRPILDSIYRVARK